MAVFNTILSLISLPAVVLGFIALVGLLLQKKAAGDVFKGTLKTILGQLIIAVGTSALISALSPIQTFFEKGIPSSGFVSFVTYDEAVVGAVQTANLANLGAEIAWTMLFGYVVHILVSRYSKYHYIYLTGHMIWVQAGAFALLFHSFGLSTPVVVVLASIVDGIYLTMAPALAQPIMRKITGSDEIAFGHGQTLLNMLGAWAGKLVGKPEDSAEKVEIKESFSFLRDMSVSISIIMLLVAFVGAGLAISKMGIAAFQEQISGGQSWFVYTLLIALNFTAGVLVLLQGVRMLIAEITPAFKGIAEKLIPGAKPALDCPVIYPYAPNSLIFGLISGTIGQVAGMVLLALIHWPVPLPSMIAAFFASGAGAIFGNATGGRKGAWLGGFLWGFVGWLLISFAYKFQVFGDLSALGAVGLGFTIPDAIVPGIAIWGIAKLFGL